MTMKLSREIIYNCKWWKFLTPNSHFWRPKQKQQKKSNGTSLLFRKICSELSPAMVSFLNFISSLKLSVNVTFSPWFHKWFSPSEIGWKSNLSVIAFVSIIGWAMLSMPLQSLLIEHLRWQASLLWVMSPWLLYHRCGSTFMFGVRSSIPVLVGLNVWTSPALQSA